MRSIKENYEIERDKKKEEKRKGFKIHRNIYFSVIGLLAVINTILVPEFIWFVFPLVGWGAGLTLHYVLAIKKDL